MKETKKTNSGPLIVLLIIGAMIGNNFGTKVETEERFKTDKPVQVEEIRSKRIELEKIVEEEEAAIAEKAAFEEAKKKALMTTLYSKE
jgi:hypothetical protein